MDQILHEFLRCCLSREDVFVCSSSLEAGLKWRTVVEYSRYYDLSPPSEFLEICAEDNNWLSFLIYAQIFSYESSQVGKFTAMSPRR